MSILDGIPNEFPAVNRRNVFPERSCCPVGTTLHLGGEGDKHERTKPSTTSGRIYTLPSGTCWGKWGGLRTPQVCNGGGFIRVRGKSRDNICHLQPITGSAEFRGT
ncbi:hypothetical protein CDAR_559331 [Caerostris darwini]|uniref:Uncharacterized protein n=1 Tax=Caerostris darwini TaxID=1538125 RepID=A0AAV4P4V7_9ARAC|nr:hypothetical protein CDAR_559331 [Caerostris darwini]